MSNGCVIWITGLPAAGKSFLAEGLCAHFKKQGRSYEWLDGDIVRDVISNFGFDASNRDLHLKYIGYIASTLEKHGIIAICSFISPRAEQRTFARSLAKTFVEVFVDTPLDVCIQRDPKGLYAAAERGEISNFTGVTSPYDEPKNPEVTLDSSQLSLEEQIDKVMQFLRR